MTTWRDRTPRNVKDDLDELTDLGLHTAHGMLEEHGEFYPFAVMVSVDGEPSLGLIADEDIGQRPDAAVMLDDLLDGLRSNRDELRCGGVVYDATQDAAPVVRVFLEHREGRAAVAMAMPYEKARFRKKIAFGDLEGEETERRIWLA